MLKNYYFFMRDFFLRIKLLFFTVSTHLYKPIVVGGIYILLHKRTTALWNPPFYNGYIFKWLTVIDCMAVCRLRDLEDQFLGLQTSSSEAIPALKFKVGSCFAPETFRKLAWLLTLSLTYFLGVNTVIWISWALISVTANEQSNKQSLLCMNYRYRVACGSSWYYIDFAKSLN